MNEPRRGEVWMVDLGMAAKVRPCLVISIGALEQDRALATLVPHTTSARNSRFEVKLNVSFCNRTRLRNNEIISRMCPRFGR